MAEPPRQLRPTPPETAMRHFSPLPPFPPCRPVQRGDCRDLWQVCEVGPVRGGAGSAFARTTPWHHHTLTAPPPPRRLRECRVAYPGFNCIWCCTGERVAGGLSLRIQQIDVRCVQEVWGAGVGGGGAVPKRSSQAERWLAVLRIPPSPRALPPLHLCARDLTPPPPLPDPDPPYPGARPRPRTMCLWTSSCRCSTKSSARASTRVGGQGWVGRGGWAGVGKGWARGGRGRGAACWRLQRYPPADPGITRRDSAAHPRRRLRAAVCSCSVLPPHRLQEPDHELRV